LAVTFLTGFEAQGAATDGVTLTGTAAYSTAQFRTGVASLRCNPAAGIEGDASLQTAPGNGYIHFGMYVASLPSNDRQIFGRSVLTAGSIVVRLNSAGALAVYLETTLIGTSSAAFASAGWHWVGIRLVTGTSVVFLQIDGTNEVTGTATVTASSTLLGPSLVGAAPAVDVYFDDVIEDGAGFLASSQVDIALPISDNTRTAVVTGDGAGTTNLWDAVNNTPPAGVASASETATTNIEYPASTTEDYIANLETYTTLGVGAADTVLAVQSVVRHGEDVGTNTKTMQNCGALTNPTVAGATVTFGNDGGAHGAEVGLWITAFGTLTTSPSVTLGTSPTIRASRTSEARVGCIDFMGMLVAWTPAAAKTAISFYRPYTQLLAQ
jgi:hypothetical protein